MAGFLYFLFSPFIYISDCGVGKINRIQKYFFNGLLVSAGSIILHSISVIFNIFISNKIGAEAMGLITLVSGVYGFAITLSTSGVNLAVVRLVSSALPYGNKTQILDTGSDKAVKRIMINATKYCLFFSFAASILLFSCARPIGKFLLDDIRVIPSIKVMAFSLVPIAISSMLNGYFCAVRRVYKNVIVQFFEQGVKISTITFLLLLISPNQIEYASLFIALGGLVSELASLSLNLTLYVIDRKKHNSTKKESVEIKENRSYSVFSCAFPVAVSAYVRSALSTIEHLAIPWGLKKSGIGAGKALASYGILHGMVFPLIFFPSSVLGAFSSLLVPEIASSYEAKDFGRIKNIVSYVFGFSLLFSVGVSGIFISFANEIGAYFFVNDEASEFIRLIAPLIPLMYLDSAVDAILKGLGEHIYTMRVNIIDSLISIILIVMLVPSLGIYGYVAVIFITELLNTSMSIIKLLNKSEVKPKILKWIFKPLLCIIMSTLLCRLIFNSGAMNTVLSSLMLGKISTILEIGVCALLYIIFSKITGVISSEEISLAKNIVKKKA